MNASNHQQKIRMQTNKGSLYKPQEERQGTIPAQRGTRGRARTHRKLIVLACCKLRLSSRNNSSLKVGRDI